MTVAGAVIGSIVTILVAHAAGFLTYTLPTVPSQLDQILAASAEDGLQPVYIRSVDLQGTGAVAQLIVLRPISAASQPKRSDELRIYEVVNGSIHMVYAARPTSLSNGVPYQIALRGVGKFGPSDREEAILTLDPAYVDGPFRSPVALLWNVAHKRYELQALLPELGSLGPLRGAWASGYKGYRTTTIRLAEGGSILHVGGAPEIAIARSRMAAAYPVDQACNHCAGTWEIKVWCINFEGPTLLSYELPDVVDEREQRRLVYVGREWPELLKGPLRIALRSANGCE